MADPSPSSRAGLGWALRGAGALVAHGTIAGLFLGAGITLRAVVDARADRPAARPVAAATTTTTDTTIPMPTTSTLFRVSPTTTSPAAAPRPPSSPPAPVATAAQVPAVPADRRAVWFALADCESGRWGAGKIAIAGTATWDVVDPIHQGGLQIRAGQWDQHRPAGFPQDAHVATPEQQIAVAEIILAGQGWRAWPTCGPRIGLGRLSGEVAGGA